MLARHQTEPGSQVAAIFELCPLANCGDDCGRRLWTNALDAREALAGLIRLEHGLDLLIKNFYPPIKIAEQVPQLADRLASHHRQGVALVEKYFRNHASRTGD